MVIRMDEDPDPRKTAARVESTLEYARETRTSIRNAHEKLNKLVEETESMRAHIKLIQEDIKTVRSNILWLQAVIVVALAMMSFT